MQQKLVWDSINFVLIGSKKAARDEKRPSLKQKNTPVAQAVTEERKFSTGGAKDYILCCVPRFNTLGPHPLIVTLGRSPYITISRLSGLYITL